MSANAEARLSSLDRVLDAQPVSEAMADDLFAAVDALGAQPALRRALTDPTTADEARAAMASSLFGGKVSDGAVAVIGEASRLRWSTTGALASALEREAIRALFGVAQRAGQLDEVEDQLFKVGRLVDANRDLRATLADRQTPVAARQDLLGGLITGRVSPLVDRLARRAVLARARTFDLTLESYLGLAADLRRRAIATVEVARPMTADQEARLRAALTAQVGREVNLRVVVNPAVLGGVRVSLGDEVIEGTVAGRLADAERKLS